MRDILVERDALAVGHVRATFGVGHGLSSLIWREVQRLWRYPKRLLLLVVSVGVPYAVGALGLDSFNPFISALILLIAFVPLLNSLRVVSRTRGLARMLPFTKTQQRFALVAVAAFLAVLWAAAATPAFWGLGALREGTLTGAAIRALLTAMAGLLAAFRWVTAKSADYSTPMMQTGFGALPPSLMFNLFKGLDIVVVMTGPLLLGWPDVVSIIIGGIVLFALSGAVDVKEAQQRQKEMKEQEERERGGGPGAKKKIVAPPRR
jgi:signal transduction histidine kinase